MCCFISHTALHVKKRVNHTQLKKTKSCSFSVKALDNNDIAVRRLESNFKDTVTKLSRIYRLKCPDSVMDWDTFLLPKFLTMVGLGMNKLKKELGVNDVKHKYNNKN